MAADLTAEQQAMLTRLAADRLGLLPADLSDPLTAARLRRSLGDLAEVAAGLGLGDLARVLRSHADR